MFRLLIAMFALATSACASDATEAPFVTEAIASFDEP